jgi:hypothetical protein
VQEVPPCGGGTGFVICDACTAGELSERNSLNSDNVWKNLYKAAILETDDGKLEKRLQTAKAAIDARLHELQLDHGGTPEELQAISDALTGLNASRTDLEARSHGHVLKGFETRKKEFSESKGKNST